MGRIVPALVVSALLVVAAPPLTAPAAAQVTCGTSVTTDLTLTADMTCAGTALIVAADGITIDLNGHTLTGDGVTVGAAGIRNNGYNGVTLTNGTITQFFFGVHLEAAAGNTISGITVNANFFSGIFLEDGSDDNRIERCLATNNGTTARRGNGITINGSSGNVVSRSYASGNYTQGIFVGGGGMGGGSAASSNTRISMNTSEANVSNGIGVIGGSGHAVVQNVTAANGAHGISFSAQAIPGSVTGSTITGNAAEGNTLNGIALSDAHDNRITANQVDGNTLTGIALTGSDGNVLIANRGSGNLVHGLFIRSGSDANDVRGNVFDANGSRGVFVGPGGGDVPSGNTFTGNGAEGNGGLFDVQDQTIGDRTAGTDSTWRGTRCEDASPAAICRP